MKLHIIGTGSSGNCYILEGESSALIIECGKHFMDVKKSLNFDVGKIVGCIVTHEHGDHAKYVSEFVSSSFPVYGSTGTVQALRYGGIKYKSMLMYETKKRFELGDFKIFPFDIEHDAVDPHGFIITHPECGNVLFVTDTKFLRYKFPRLNQIIIEANYCEEILAEKTMRTGMGFLRDRIIESHMSLAQCKETIQSNDLSAVQNIVLIHLSDSNSHEVKFKSEIEKATGKQVHVASNGMKIDFNLIPF